MSAPLTPAPLPELAYSRFRFAPAIAGAGPNEWTLRRATWTEMVVVNAITAEELAIPRRFLGRVFETEENIRDVRLTEDLESAGGRARPVRRGVIEMKPRVGVETPAWRRPEPGLGAPVLAIRTEYTVPSRTRRALRGSIAIGFVAFLAVVFVTRDSRIGPGLTAGDDYRSVRAKLGEPLTDEWLQAPGGSEYRRMWYPGKRLAVILAGETRDSAHYAGALSRSGRVLHAAVADVMDRVPRGTVER